MSYPTPGEYDDAVATMRSLGIKKGVDLWTNAVIVAGALQRGLDVRAGSRQRIVLSRGRTTYGWMDGATNFNTLLARRCARQKELTSRLLRSRGLAAPENVVFSPGQVDRAYSWAAPILPVVVKPFDGNQGRGVHMNIDDYGSFCAAYQDVSENFGDVLVEELVPGIEHRALVVAGRVVAVTRRVPAHVVGDGIRSVSDLVVAKNLDRGRVHKQITIDERVQRYLRRQGLSTDHVPADDEIVTLRPTSNLHTGGDAVDATEDLTNEEIELIEKSAAAIPGLRVGGFDLLLPRNGNGTTPMVLEVNPSPMISMHHFPQSGTPRDVAGAVLDAMFPVRS